MTKPPLFPSQYREGTTLAVRTYSAHDPKQRKDYTPITIGAYVIQRRPLPGTPMTHYLIYRAGNLVGTQSSYPTESDCRACDRRSHSPAISAT